MSGLGGGTADLTQPGNLGALAFVPLGDKAWSATEDGVLTLYGVEGVTITDSDGGEAKVTIKADSVKMELGGASVELADDEVRIVGTLKINGDDYLAHAHSGVQSGGSNTGGVV
jgi:hypothetical protein